MDTLSTHYARLLGLDDSWRVDAVDLRLEERRVEIRLAHIGSGVACPECGQSCGLADHAEEVCAHQGHGLALRERSEKRLSGAYFAALAA